MARNERTGNRKTREQRKKNRVPELGYYLIVTDTEATERCYFNGLHDSLPNEIQDKLVIRVFETKTREMIDKCMELTAYEAQYRMPWIVFDRDQVNNFDEIIREAKEKGEWAGQIHALKYGCMLTSVSCLHNHGHVVLNLGKYMKTEQDRNISRLTVICTAESVRMAMRRRLLKSLSRNWNSVLGMGRQNHQKCGRVQRCMNLWLR